jgi:uncharacterized membrane protein
LAYDELRSIVRVLWDVEVMTRIEKQVIVAKPAAEVLHFAGDWRNIPTYLDYIQEVKPLTEITEGKGARYLVNLTYLGRKMTSEWETVEYDQGEGWTFATPLMGIVARKHWRFEPMGESTRVSLVLEYDPKPPIIAPLADVLLLRRKWDQICERGVRNLKRAVEGGAARKAAAV